jgi:hypothetical protein
MDSEINKMRQQKITTVMLVLAYADQIQGFHSASQVRRSSAGLVFNGRYLIS